MALKKRIKKAKQEKIIIKKTDLEPAGPEKIERLISELKTGENLVNAPKTLLKKEEWGLITVLSLILAGIFPIYFVNILMISFLTELGHFWTTHLNEVGRLKLIEFEKEFRKGYELENQDKWDEAVRIYESLVPKYKDNPKISGIAIQRIEWIEKNRDKVK
jgi:hypothetical protein